MDRTQMVMVFQYLVGNSLKHRRAEPLNIRIEAVLEGSDWRVAVADNGQGFNPEHASAISRDMQGTHDHSSDLPIADKIARILSGHNRGSIPLDDRYDLQRAGATDTGLRVRDLPERSQYSIEFGFDHMFDPRCPLDLTNAASHGPPSNLVNDMDGPPMMLSPAGEGTRAA